MTNNHTSPALVWEGNKLYLAWPGQRRECAGKITFDPHHQQWAAWGDDEQYLGSFTAAHTARETVNQRAAKTAAEEPK